MTPTIFYKCPGQHRGPKGMSYNFKGVSTQEQADLLMKNGWSISLHDAVEGTKPKPEVKIEVKTEKIEEIKSAGPVDYTDMQDEIKKSESKPKPKPKAKAKPKAKPKASK